MDSGEWSYGQGDNDRPQHADPTPSGPADPAPNLWAEDPASAWGPTEWASSGSGLPRQRQPEPADATVERPAVQPDGWYASPGTSEWGRPRHAAPAVQAGPPVAAGPPVPGGVGPVSPGGGGAYARTGVDSWARPELRPRRRVTEAEEYGVVRRQRDVFGDEPAYGPVLGFTAGWYGIPAVFYLVWLVTLDSDRQAIVGRTFLASLPWLFAAVVLSLAVAGLLRWAIVGWRALTLSFAAAVIGAGVTTIAHSLAL